MSYSYWKAIYSTSSYYCEITEYSIGRGKEDFNKMELEREEPGLIFPIKYFINTADN